MPHLPLDRYLRYDELTSLLKAWAEEFPGLVQLSSIGLSHEGRDIWLLTLTDSSTGPDNEKPAFWVDGNIHASEVSASSASLKVIDILLSEKADLLKTRAFYVCPRLNPDGAEWALADVPKIIRSSTRPYPYDEDDVEGLEKMDVNGDGRMLFMRIKDSNGPWKIAEDEPRLMKKREPGETGGEYFRVIPEGLIHNWDGLTLRPRKVKEGLDMNRNYPSGWRPENEQKGAGPYPTSEPEIRAQVDFIANHPNICGAVCFHTYSGVLLRPPGREAEENLPPEDVWTFKELGEKGTQMTGYPAISVFHDFKYHPKEVISGVFDDWMYEHRGVHAWTVEIWSPQKQAGIGEYKWIDWYRTHPWEDDLKMLAWSDEKLGGRGYVAWTPFEHPQLGSVEIGGWDTLLCWRNPPVEFLEKEVTPLAEWTVWLGSLTPRLEERAMVTEETGGVFRLRWAVQNTGWLPTQVTTLAEKKGLCRGVVAEISREEGPLSSEAGTHEPIWLVSGSQRRVGGQLSGWSMTPAGSIGYSFDDTSDVAVFEWVVTPGTYHLTAKHERAGLIRRTVSVSV
jgi:murein tripeptide amidase MpaA